jgi:hypothetical protein
MLADQPLRNPVERLFAVAVIIPFAERYDLSARLGDVATVIGKRAAVHQPASGPAGCIKADTIDRGFMSGDDDGERANRRRNRRR